MVLRALSRIWAHGRKLGRARAPRNTSLWNGPAPRRTYLRPDMRPGARTPEELESLLEDAFLTRDAEALREMFDEGAVLIAGARRQEARGRGAIGRLASSLWAARSDLRRRAAPGRAGARHGARPRRRRDQRRAPGTRRRLALRDRAPGRRPHDPRRGGTMTQQSDTALEPVAVRTERARRAGGSAPWPSSRPQPPTRADR